jgi:hypothetical protein
MGFEEELSGQRLRKEIRRNSEQKEEKQATVDAEKSQEEVFVNNLMQMGSKDFQRTVNIMPWKALATRRVPRPRVATATRPSEAIIFLTTTV